MATAIIDLSDLVSDDEPDDDPPRIQLGDEVVMLPEFMPADFMAAYGAVLFASSGGSDTDRAEAALKLSTVVTRLAGPLAERAPTMPIASAIMKAYKTGEAPASSD